MRLLDIVFSVQSSRVFTTLGLSAFEYVYDLWFLQKNQSQLVTYELLKLTQST